jgi:hypothetical protein
VEEESLRSQIVILKPGRGRHRKFPPYAFTEQGVAMLSSVLGSAQAIAVNIEIMRAFVRLREVIATSKELAQRIDDLENKTDLMEVKQGTFEHNARVQFKQIFEALREMMAQPEPPKKRPIGFVTPDDTPAKPKAAKGKAIKAAK